MTEQRGRRRRRRGRGRRRRREEEDEEKGKEKEKEAGEPQKQEPHTKMSGKKTNLCYNTMHAEIVAEAIRSKAKRPKPCCNQLLQAELVKLVARKSGPSSDSRRHLKLLGRGRAATRRSLWSVRPQLRPTGPEQLCRFGHRHV